jgi:hypothetical protein
MLTHSMPEKSLYSKKKGKTLIEACLHAGYLGTIQFQSISVTESGLNYALLNKTIRRSMINSGNELDKLMACPGNSGFPILSNQRKGNSPITLSIFSMVKDRCDRVKLTVNVGRMDAASLQVVQN